MTEEFPDLARWDKGQADELNGDEHRPSDRMIEAKADAAREKAQQAHDFRRRLFSTITRVVVCTLFGAACLMGAYVWSQWGELDRIVVISFNAAVVVNTVGLAYIVANYLFPKGGAD